MLAMTIIVGILLGGFTVVVTVNYIKERPDSVVQLMMPIITFVATIATMIMALIGIIQIHGGVTSGIFVLLIIFVVIYCIIMDSGDSNDVLNPMSTLSICFNLVALIGTLFAVSTWG